MMPFDLNVNNKIALDYLSRSKILLDHIHKRIAPEPIGKDIEQCKYCSYKHFCEKDSRNNNINFEKEEKLVKNKITKRKRSGFSI